jgi:hypothetical protein
VVGKKQVIKITENANGRGKTERKYLLKPKVVISSHSCEKRNSRHNRALEQRIRV